MQQIHHLKSHQYCQLCWQTLKRELRDVPLFLLFRLLNPSPLFLMRRDKFTVPVYINSIPSPFKTTYSLICSSIIEKNSKDSLNITEKNTYKSHFLLFKNHSEPALVTSQLLDSLSRSFKTFVGSERNQAHSRSWVMTSIISNKPFFFSTCKPCDDFMTFILIFNYSHEEFFSLENDSDL